MVKTITIGGKPITLNASIWTWLEYKRIFKRDWQSDRSAQLGDIVKAVKFEQEYAGLTDEQFEELPQEKQDAYWHGLKDNKVDLEFTLNTIYAMAVAGGYTGTRKEFYEGMSGEDLRPEGELMRAYAELVDEFFPTVKKK